MNHYHHSTSHNKLLIVPQASVEPPSENIVKRSVRPIKALNERVGNAERNTYHWNVDKVHYDPPNMHFVPESGELDNQSEDVNE
jgi:hypothetical protein